MNRIKYLGIDFGEKRVGLALSDDEGRVAFPETVLTNDKLLMKNVENIVQERGVTDIVIGASYDLRGDDNEIMHEIRKFKEKLEKKLNLPIYFEFELYSTVAAKRVQGNVEYIDASAAAIILQSYLDRLQGN